MCRCLSNKTATFRLWTVITYVKFRTESHILLLVAWRHACVTSTELKTHQISCTDKTAKKESIEQIANGQNGRKSCTKMTKQLTFCETSAYQIVTRGGITNGAGNSFSFINTLNFFKLEPLLSAQEGILVTPVPDYSGSHIFKKPD